MEKLTVSSGYSCFDIDFVSTENSPVPSRKVVSFSLSVSIELSRLPVLLLPPPEGSPGGILTIIGGVSSAAI